MLNLKALETVHRVLGFCDRQEGSLTAGCCDRMYWHYRLTDFANARYQEAGLLFAIAYNNNLPGNIFYNKSIMKQWVREVWNFWLSDRNKDGSTHEAYPFERSFCSTAFSSAAFVETISLLRDAEEWKDELKLCEPTMKWLAKNSNKELANQMAASLLALTGYSILTGDSGFAKLAKKRRDDVLSLEDNGVFQEYGGLDIGYQSITMSALARTMVLSGDVSLEPILRRSEKLLSSMVRPDGRVDSSKNSRNTQFLYPYSFAVLRSGLLNCLEKGLEEGVTLNPTWMDDRYCIALAIDYFMAALEVGHANEHT